MKRILLFTLVIGLFAVQAYAVMYELDAPTARTFTQLSPSADPQTVLHLVIDNPGSPGSSWYIDDGYFGAPGSGTGDYVDPMQLAVGFAGHITGAGVGNVMVIGTAGDPGVFDSLVIPIANDNDDTYRYHAWYSTDNMATTVQGAGLDLTEDTQGVVSVGLPAVVTNFGFDLDYIGSSSGDDFHTSVVPVPGAILLGILGLGVAGWKLRKFA